MDEYELKLVYMRDCVDAYGNPLGLPAYRRTVQRRKLVQATQWPIRERLNELEETLGFVLEAYHRESEYKKYVNLPIRKRAQNSEPSFYPRIGDTEAKREIIYRAGQYLDLPWMHCCAATDLFLLAVLDAEFVPLDREVRVIRRFVILDALPRLAFLALVICWIASKQYLSETTRRPHPTGQFSAQHGPYRYD